MLDNIRLVLNSFNAERIGESRMWFLSPLGCEAHTVGDHALKGGWFLRIALGSINVWRCSDSYIGGGEHI